MVQPLKRSHRLRFGIDKSFCTTTHLPVAIKAEALKAIDRIWAAYLKDRFGKASISDLSREEIASLYSLMRSEIEDKL